MSITTTCDLCGREITAGQAQVSLTSDGRKSDGRWTAGWLAHFHTADRGQANDCYDRFYDLVDLVREQAQNLAAIPVASTWQIEAERRKHTVPGQAEAAKSLAGVKDLPPRACWALIRVGVDLKIAAEMSDEELLAIQGVGPLSVRVLRRGRRRLYGRRSCRSLMPRPDHLAEEWLARRYPGTRWVVELGEGPGRDTRGAERRHCGRTSEPGGREGELK